MIDINKAAIDLDQHLRDTDPDFIAVGIANEVLIVYSQKPEKITIDRWQEHDVTAVYLDQPKPAEINT